MSHCSRAIKLNHTGDFDLATTTTGWPDATNTGVPAGVTLTPSGDLVITQAGTVISGLNISGTVYINAPNVTIENCKITAASFAVVQIKQGVTGAVVQNCEINGVGSNNDGSNGISGQGTFTGNNIYNVENGINVQGSSTITGNYIHDLKASGSPHYDGIQVDGGVSNVTISHNTVINDYSQTSAVMVDNYFGPISNVSVSNNLLVGGGFTVYSDAQFNGGSITGVSFTNNHMGSGYWGVTDFNLNSPTYTGNVNDGATLASALNTSANQGPTTSPSPAPSAPVIASWSPDTGATGDGVTDANKISLHGTAAAGSTVKVYDGSTQIGTATANSSGSWDYITSVLTDAKHALTATATNASGQTGVASAALAVTVDTKAPTAPTIASHSVNSANQVVLSGNAEVSSVVKVFDGTTQIGTAMANSSGVWGYTSAALAAGSHSFTAKAMDVAGNTGAASTVFAANIGTSTSPTTPTSPTPTPDKVIESAGATSLVESGGKFYLNGSSGSGPSLKNHGVDFVDGSDYTWAPIGAEKTATGYLVAWKEASTGRYTAWNTDNNGNYVSHVSALTGSTSGGSVSGTNSGLKSLETSFHQDLNGDGQIGTSSASTPTSPTPTPDKVIESAGATSLVETGGKFYLNGSSGSGPSLKNHGVDFVDGSDYTWAPIGAEKTATGYLVAWKEASSGQYTAWNTDNNGNYVSHVSTLTGSTSGGSVSGTDSGLKSLETSFHQDLNSDGHIGTSTATASSTVSDSTSQVVATSGSTLVASTGNTTLKGTSGNDIFVGSSQADTFVFGANFGHDVIKDFVARGPAHDTIEFSKTVFDSFASVLSHAAQSGGDVVLATGSDTLTLKNTKLDALTSHDFHFA
ncbi:Ig-like domain-containing protein [Bradyrhizobium sp. 150]|uniref:Ig-like domain-containing protein n=1 Tax=Bradyrhizobium sp. 150 TaxID=2782625 RepID=UPI0031F7042C